jgi:hypothetical protein
MDYKFWATLAVNVIGLAIMVWQVRLMKQKVAEMPVRVSAEKRLTIQRQLSRRMYVPVFVMAGLVMLSWLPYIVRAGQPYIVPQMLVAWAGAANGCTAALDTSALLKVRDKYRLFLVCQIANPTVDPLEDRNIAISKPFNINGGLVQIAISYEASAPIASVAKPGTATNFIIVVLPKDQDGSRITRLGDVETEGGQIIIPGGKLKL